MTFYKKKKRKVGPSKNDEKVQRAQYAQAQASAAGTLSSRFPNVRGLKLVLSITSPQGVVLQEENEQISGNDAFQIETDCAGRCGSGSFDFAPLVAEALGRGDAAGQVEFSCGERVYGGGTDLCSCIARCAFQTS